MSGTVILNELCALCAEIRSEKVTTRNKAAERLDNILTNSRTDLIVIFKNKNQTNDISWSEIFNSVIVATLKHAAKVEESQDTKSVQALRNKNHIFNAILNKLIDYSVEDNNNFLTKSTLLTAFFDGCSIRSALKSFGMLFLYVLDTGIYKSPEMVCQLKVNEFSRILSYLFEVNITNDENLRFAVLRSINKTIELAEYHVQLKSDLKDYFPEIRVYASNASDDRRKSEVIKLYYLFISQLSLDYHSSVCSDIQDLLPVICGFYNFRMKVESKEIFFKSIYISLLAIYPFIKNINCNSINVTLKPDWNKTLKKLETIMEMEIKERRTQLYRPGDIINEMCLGIFIKMSAFVVYLIHWHVKQNDDKADENLESRKKVRKIEDKLETILALVQPKNTTFNEIWLAILADLISTYETVLNISNYQQVLEVTFQLLCVFNSASSIKDLRQCITSLLRFESELLVNKSVPANHCKDIWPKFVQFVIDDNSTNNSVINEKQLILQSLIAHKKLSLHNINELLQAYISNKAMRRSECIATIRQILLYANAYELDKTSELIGRVINWVCETYYKIDAKSILLNIAPIDVELLMDTSAIAVINFLNENEQFVAAVDTMSISHNMRLLLYKYNRKIMCIEEHGMKLRKNGSMNSQNTSEEIKNCLFQSNYTLLMRLLNLETSKETSHSNISLDLSHLNTLVCLMKYFLKYGIFSAENFTQCPLIKRIGLFLSHLEFQLKSNDPKNIDRADLLEILQHIEKSFMIFSSNEILLNYLEAQPLDELILFVGKTLKFSANQHMSYELSDWSCITFACLKILSILCASTSHFKDAFGHIDRHVFNMKSDLNDLMHLIQIFCSQRHVYPEVAVWYVNKIKIICHLYHTNVEISARIIELLPVMFSYVQHQTGSLDNMLIVLSSFLKKTYKKSYSIDFAVNLMNSIKKISKNCAHVFDKEDFINICLSTAKFISCPSLEIQFATINTITALMDASWFCVPTNFHLEFCEKLMLQIDFKGLPATSTDITLNSVSVTTQLLVALFMFSSYHQEIALQELAYFCALRKLNECDFFKFQDIAAYFNCNLFELTSPYQFNLIHQWTEKQYPILKFPYFLCANTKDEFMLQNISKITSSILIHSKANHLKKLECYKSQSELIELSYSTVYAISLPLQSDCTELDTTKSNYIKGMVKNLQLLGVSLQNNNNKSNKIDWEIIYNLMDIFSDNSHFEEMFKFLPSFRQPKWFNIGYDALLECLNYYLKRNMERNAGPPLFSLISKHSLVVVKVFNALKKKTTNSFFPIDKLKYYHVYCTFAKLIVDCIETNASRTTDQGCFKYFIRDIIYYSLQTLQDSRDSINMQSACLTFVQQLLETPLIAVGFCNDILKSNFNYIIKILVSSAENAHCSEIREITTKTIHAIIFNNKNKFNEAIVMLDEFPSNECFDKLREIQMSVSSEEDKDVQNIVQSFLKVENRGTESLKMIRNSIAKNKSRLTLENATLCQFIKRLIVIVRNTKNNKFALEAAKCLGEIGSLKMIGYSYYFATDDLFYNAEAASQRPIEFFAENLLRITEKMLLTYNKKTFTAICSIAEQVINSENGKRLLGSFPYLSVFRVHSARANPLDTYDSIEAIDMLSILRNTDHLNYDDWICTFVAKIYKQIKWKHFEELALLDKSFAVASVIPIFKLLVSNTERHLQHICAMLDYFFNESFKAISNRRTSNLKSIYKEKRLIKIFLNVCECIRIHNEWNVPINLLHVAKACNYCQAYFLSIMYLEMWTTNEKSAGSEKSNLEVISNEIFQDVSTEAYQSIGCCDAISGFLNPLNSRIEFLNLEGSWSDVLLQADANATEMGSSTLYIDKLKRNGVLSLANLCKPARQIDYETSWKLCQWDTIVEGHSKINTLNDMGHEFEKHHFNALKCIYNREEVNSLAAITNARNCVISILKEISVECLQSVYKYLTCLHLLEQAEEFCQIQFASPNEVSYIFEKWDTERNMQYGNFWCKEQALSHQVTLFKTAGIRANRKIKEHFKDINPIELCLLKCITECKRAGEMNLAIRNIAALKNMKLSNEQTRVAVLLEDAELCFKTGKPLITKAILQHVLKNNDFAFCLERVKAFRMHGEYLMESNSETFETVLRTCFKGSIELLKQFAKNKEQILARNPNLFDIESFDEFERTNRKQAYESIAKYADREYTQLNIYINSEEFQMKCKIIEENRQAAETVGKQNKDRDKNIGALFMKKNANLDEKEVLTVKQKCSDFLCIAVKNYMLFCIIDQAITSPAVYRIIALWFANKQNESLQAEITQNLPDIPSYKFLCALNQMTARLSSTNKGFISLLKDILVRCVQDHPHQTLYQLFPLVFAFNDSNNIANKSNDRVNITKEIISKAKNKSNSSSIKQLEIMFPALIDFANEALKETNVSLSDKLKRLKNLDAIQCPTMELPVAISKTYSITSIVKWEDKISLVGGINAPKKLTCICSDGQKRAQLLKGKDDLRQDAVMQQVFSMINDLLKCEPETNDRKLNLRTYRIVPLSMRSGILEWCPNTIPIGVYLAGDGKSGAHKKYRPNDYTIQKCRTMSLQHLKSDAEKRLQMYLHVCSNIKPVFHYFFFEKFLVPGEWFERRLAYINSVATTSIVGFILGLGDRHTQNILIDEKTAEVVHIDFGIAFEQGKIMPTPETVPFRLTRDMVAPMGVCETNGVFKKSCEATMKILRRNQAVITTILEVLLYDPLYIWKVVQVSDEEAHDGKNLTAQRALLCVQNKLEGKQAGIFGTLDVEIQVQRLINDAILSQNLCMLYPGWDPYL